jgi:muramoyltetrapeptide carboxypeptidase
LQYEFPAHPQNRKGLMEGEIVGGNLSVLYGMIGSNTFPELDGKILFIEEVDEYIYHIDRMMHALKRAGKLANLKGLVIGGLTQIHDNSHPFGMSVEEVITEAVADFDYPVCFGFPAGHFDDNRAVFFGLDSQLLVADKKVVFVNASDTVPKSVSERWRVKKGTGHC